MSGSGPNAIFPLPRGLAAPICGKHACPVPKNTPTPNLVDKITNKIKLAVETEGKHAKMNASNFGSTSLQSKEKQLFRPQLSRSLHALNTAQTNGDADISMGLKRHSISQLPTPTFSIKNKSCVSHNQLIPPKEFSSTDAKDMSITDFICHDGHARAIPYKLPPRMSLSSASKLVEKQLQKLVEKHKESNIAKEPLLAHGPLSFPSRGRRENENILPPLPGCCEKSVESALLLARKTSTNEVSKKNIIRHQSRSSSHEKQFASESGIKGNVIVTTNDNQPKKCDNSKLISSVTYGPTPSLKPLPQEPHHEKLSKFEPGITPNQKQLVSNVQVNTSLEPAPTNEFQLFENGIGIDIQLNHRNETTYKDSLDMFDPISYPPTIHQLFLLNQFTNTSNPSLPAISISCYKINDQPIQPWLLCRAINRVSIANRVFHTSFKKNFLMPDADVEAFAHVPSSLLVMDNSCTDTLCNQVQLLSTSLDSEDALVFVQEAATAMQNPLEAWSKQTPYWRVFVHDDPNANSTKIYVAMSPLIGDERSADLLVGLAWLTYKRSIIMGFSASSLYSIPRLAIISMSNEKIRACEQNFAQVCPQPITDFLEFAEDETAISSRRLEEALVVCKSQMLESKQDYVDVSRKSHLEQEIIRLETDRSAKEFQIQSLIGRMAALEIDLTQTEDARARITNSVVSGGSDEALDGNPMLIHESGKCLPGMNVTVARTILEDEIDAGVVGLLCRHGISEASATKFTNMTLEEFSFLSEIDVCQVYRIVGREKRQILAVVDMVKNRIKDAVSELSKMKFDLERRTLKLRRDITSLRSQLKSKSVEVDRLAHIHMQCRNLIHPPRIYSVIPLACINVKMEDGKTPYTSLADLVSIPLPLSLPLCFRRSTSLQLFQYAREFCTGKSEEDSNGIGYVLLALFAILVKHVSGMDMFVIGYKVSLRHSRTPQGIAFGPGLSVTMPLRINLRDMSTPFHIFVQRVTCDAQNLEKRAVHIGSDARIYHLIEKDIGEKQQLHELENDWPGQASYRPMVSFEYIKYSEMQFLERNGVSPQTLLRSLPKDLLHGRNEDHNSHFPSTRSNVMIKEWSTTTDHSHPDLHLTAIEMSVEGDSLAGMLEYRRDVAPRVSERWLDKLYSLLDGVDVAQRQTTIASLISRFYHSVWANGSSQPSDGTLFKKDSITNSAAELRQKVAAYIA